MAIGNAGDAVDGQLSDKEPHELVNFAPCFDDATMGRIEEVANSQAIGVSRRCMLMVLARGADTSARFSSSKPEAFRELRECIQTYRDHVSEMLELAEMACARLAIADGRPVRPEGNGPPEHGESAGA
jgi:hypothetical protein